MTIEELPEEYVKSTLIGSESIKKNAYKAGAYKVLKEIEKIVYGTIFMNKAMDDLVDKINELKGKK